MAGSRDIPADRDEQAQAQAQLAHAFLIKMDLTSGPLFP
jgi:hypothetical protein